MSLFQWKPLDPEAALDLPSVIRELNIRMGRLVQALASLGNARAVKTVGNGVTIPPIAGGRTFIVQNTVPTTITAFRDGQPGDEITLWATTANTTIAHSAADPGIRMKGAANVTMAATETRRFLTVNGTAWREV